MAVHLTLSPATRSAQGRYAAILKHHPDDEEAKDAARRAWAEALAADLRRRADELEAAR